MPPRKRSTLLVLVLCLIGLAGLTAACTAADVSALPVVIATPGPEVPAAVIKARDAVLTFLRSDANCVVPPDGVRWNAVVGRAPEGFTVYVFRAEQCFVSVAYPLSADAPTYHVGLTNQDIGFCWQASVNAQGKVVSTGTAAELMPELADAAATFCEEGGNAHTVEEQPDGTHCGVCTFPDGSHCKAWLYYQGVCEPGTH